MGRFRRMVGLWSVCDETKRATSEELTMRLLNYTGFVWIVMDLCEAGSVADVIEICRRKLRSVFVTLELKGGDG